jgi:hypothetical protein
MWDAGNVAIRFVGCRSPHASGAAAVNAANAQSAILAGHSRCQSHYLTVPVLVSKFSAKVGRFNTKESVAKRASRVQVVGRSKVRDE